MGRSLSSSRLTEPPGPVSVMVARFPSHAGITGRTKANDELPSPSAVSGMVKLREKSSTLLAVRPVTTYSPAESGSAAGASTTKAGSRNGSLSALTPPQRRRDLAGVAAMAALATPSSLSRNRSALAK